MDVNQMLQQTGAVEALSRELGVDPSTAQAGAAALLPSILSGFQNPVAASAAPAASQAPSALGGLGGLLGTIGALGGGALLDGMAEFLQRETTLATRLTEEPRYAIVRGLMQLFDEPLLLRRVARNEQSHFLDEAAFES